MSVDQRILYLKDCGNLDIWCPDKVVRTTKCIRMGGGGSSYGMWYHKSVRMWTGFTWLRFGHCSRFFWTR